MKTERIRVLRQSELFNAPIVYWMSREQRVNDNWALLFAQKKALEMNSALIVIFCLVPEFLNAAFRQYSFMIDGLLTLQSHLSDKNIEFYILQGNPEKVIPDFIVKNNISAVVTDFDPLKIKKQWKQAVIDGTNIAFYEVDAHNIVPCWHVSNKQEWAAYTFRPKVNRLLPEFLEEFPQLLTHSYKRDVACEEYTREKLLAGLNTDERVKPVTWLKSGEGNAKIMLDDFIENRLDKYAQLRNNPNVDFQSNLSPYLHFGQISAQRAALEVSKLSKNPESLKAFLEELIVRRELAENFCFYNPDYDNFNSFPDWAKKTLNEHRNDPRIPVYFLEELEHAQIHDELWNTAQLEMVKKGKMHGYMRMYWAKKILEWTQSPEEALSMAIYLNDKYELDGRDPNGYTGIAWSIGGIHDRAWGSRQIFGKIRYMSYKGLKSKFDIQTYINKIKSNSPSRS